MKVLLVENDLDQLDITAYMLRRERFVVLEASDGAEALRRFRMDRPEIVVVNLALPPPGGIEVLRQIRAEASTPVLVITPRNDRAEILRCLEHGADDFIARPYVLRELTLRIRANLRRAAGPRHVETETPLDLGDFRLDPEAHEVKRGSFVIRLTPTEFRIFHALAEHAGHVVPTRRLFASAWGGDAGDANSLRSHICHLRKKLQLDGGSRGSIASVPAVGYVYRVSMAPPETTEVSAPGELAAGS